MLLQTVATIAVCTVASRAFNTNGFKDYFVLLYKGIYVAYGNGRNSERDLPECRSGAMEGMEACNLSHQRYWKAPLIERLCRCPGHTACPLHSTDTSDRSTDNEEEYQNESGPDDNGVVRKQSSPLLVQHVNNRAHLLFCNVRAETSRLPICGTTSTVGLTILLEQRLQQLERQQKRADDQLLATDSQTRLHCLCQQPRYWKLLSISYSRTRRSSSAAPENSKALRSRIRGGPKPPVRRRGGKTVLTYKCHKLPACESGEPCSAVRPDTHESYYTCSCPPDHLCLVPANATLIGPGTGRGQQLPTHSLVHYNGPTLQGECTPHLQQQP